MTRDRHSLLEVAVRWRLMQDAWLGPVEKDQKTFYEKQRIMGSGHRCEEAGSLEACHILMKMNAFQQDKGFKLESHSNTLEE